MNGFGGLFPGETTETRAVGPVERALHRGIGRMTQELGAAIEASDIATTFLQPVIRWISGVTGESSVAGGNVVRTLAGVKAGIIEKEGFGFAGFVGENVRGEKAGDLVG